jgi:hypothetical protein
MNRRTLQRWVQSLLEIGRVESWRNFHGSWKNCRISPAGVGAWRCPRIARGDLDIFEPSFFPARDWFHEQRRLVLTAKGIWHVHCHWQRFRWWYKHFR